MDTPKPTLRQDLIQNAVNHQIRELEESALSAGRLDSLFNSELIRDLITWPRQYLEAYLDSDESGRVPLSPEQLQDVLEAAFERHEALAVVFLQGVKAGKGARTLPRSSLQIADVSFSDPEHPYELLFNEVNTEDLRKLFARMSGLSHRSEHEREAFPAPNRADIRGIDVRKLVGDAELPQHIQLALKELQPGARIDKSLTDSGVYRGNVIAETAYDFIQRISPQSAVIHRKDKLDYLPRIGDYVRISYCDSFAHVQQVRERSCGKELAR
jgi:hypothetical protein